MLKTTDDNVQDVLAVSIKDRREILFDGVAQSVSSRNKSGPFDILAHHANFITLILEYIYVDKGLPTEKRFELKNGVLTALNNNISVYIGV